ncbi:uncharacterized protein C15orf65 homolog isoform X2 [Mastomys coucha]|nr:uncharacterized protein C15orf65 homolog isoform X2 [Mastomys coucha]
MACWDLKFLLRLPPVRGEKKELRLPKTRTARNPEATGSWAERPRIFTTSGPPRLQPVATETGCHTGRLRVSTHPLPAKKLRFTRSDRPGFIVAAALSRFCKKTGPYAFARLLASRKELLLPKRLRWRERQTAI